ncbi:MAG: glycosyltransferase family 4 protein [Alphaproteobacteria bacterium]|nr:glycosyltransferase family 4 protein [Alphaproteobacteria bacterium]
MQVAVQYARPASGQTDGEIFGLDVAVNNLLRAYFKYSTQSAFICRPVDMPSLEHFKTLATSAGRNADEQCIGLDPRYPQHNLEKVDCLFRPDPLLSELVWQRQQVSGNGFATCGVVHTMSGERIARAVGDLCYAPTNGSDALICPSDAIRDAVRTLWDIQSDYIRHRFGATAACPVQTPVIPLGIDTQKFSALCTAENRAAQREALGLADDEVCLLFVGRLSFATKAHPLPLWLAAEEAAQKAEKKFRLVMYGYYKPQDMEAHFKALLTDVARHVRVDIITNDDSRFPNGLWAAGDVFVSLADNIQESFGLTPVEAMACGMPCIATDWDGYRASVRYGEDGFLIPTYQPPAEAGLDIAQAYYNYSNYGVALMGAAQSTGIDIAACTDAIIKLVDHDDLRKQMGRAAQRHAQTTFDWQRIIPQYEQLWAELATSRLQQPRGVPDGWQAVHASYPNPYEMFKGFPTAILHPHDQIEILRSREEIIAILQHEMNFFIPELLPQRETLIAVAEGIRGAGAPHIQNIMAALPVSEHNRIWRCLGWMIKHGVARLIRHT